MNPSTFDGSGAPAGPIDVTAGYQFPLVIPPASSKSVLVILSVNFSLQCDGKLKSLYCDGF